MIIDNRDLENGDLHYKSKIKHTDIMKIHKSLFVKKIGELKDITYKKVIDNILEEIKLKE